MHQVKVSQFNAHVGTFLALVPLLLALALQAEAADDGFQVQADVPYAERGGETLRMNLYIPKGKGPFPAVLLVHGGAWKMGNRWHMHSVGRQLASRGYTAASITYRLAPEHRFPAQLEDCADAVRFLRSHAAEYKIDPQRVGGFGYSAGGHLVSLLGVCGENAPFPFLAPNPQQPSSRLQAVVGGGAPCDFDWIDEDQPTLAYWLGDTRKNIPKIYEKASPETFVSPDDPPMFFYHGAQDRLVPLESPQKMSAALKEAGVKTSVYAIPRAGHLGARRDPVSIEKAIRFLDEVLKGDDEESAEKKAS